MLQFYGCLNRAESKPTLKYHLTDSTRLLVKGKGRLLARINEVSFYF